MRKTLTLLAALAALTACGGEAGQRAPDAAAATTTTTPWAAPAEDAAARGNCLQAGLAYAPIARALNGEGDLSGAVRYAGAVDVDLDPATTQPGKEANVALAELAVEISMARITASAGQPVDEGALLAAYTAAQDACAAVGIS